MVQGEGALRRGGNEANLKLEEGRWDWDEETLNWVWVRKVFRLGWLEKETVGGKGNLEKRNGQSQ